LRLVGIRQVNTLGATWNLIVLVEIVELARIVEDSRETSRIHEKYFSASLEQGFNQQGVFDAGRIRELGTLHDETVRGCSRARQPLERCETLRNPAGNSIQGPSTLHRFFHQFSRDL